MNREFESIFGRLRNILERHSGALQVTADTPTHYCLHLSYSPKFKKGFPVAWVKVSKSYVSYHFMPVYMFPKMRETMSESLKARMQGKSCFNFKVMDEELFKELDAVTSQGLAICREKGI